MMNSKEQDKLHYDQICPVDVNIRGFSDIGVTISEVCTQDRVLNKVE